MCAACPTQDVSALYTDTFGGSRLSKSTVSRVTQQLNQEFESWRQRDLKDLRVVYLFLDGQYHAARQGRTRKRASCRPTPSWTTASPCCCTWISARANRMSVAVVFAGPGGTWTARPPAVIGT